MPNKNPGISKDELLGLLHKWYRFYGEEVYLSREAERKEAYAEIKRILNLHFSISDSERKEAREWINDEPIGDATQARVYRNILKMFGEKVGVADSLTKALGEKPE